MNDETIFWPASCVMHYMLDVEKKTFNECLNLIQKKCFKFLFLKWLNSTSEVLGVVPRSLGIELTVALSKDKMQESLNVKKFKEHVEIKQNCIKPIINSGMAYSHPEFIWIRVYSTNPKENYIQVSELSKNIFEIYTPKVKSTNGGVVYEYKNKKIQSKKVPINDRNVKKMIEESLSNGDFIVFCSELPFFLSNRAAFISNYTKFMYCYLNEMYDFEVFSFEDYFLLNSLLALSLCIMYNKNLTIMPLETHNPLIRYTGDHPQRELSKVPKNKIYNVEGSRAEISMDGASDYGTRSHFIEIVGSLKLSNQNYIDDIV